ncbi:MAG TPA: SDR family oxidoreductase [Bacteriovoracaceae bacterium]|nr:SDR family oxidoreductase [Bacteriovoracaceae bacterium]
MQKNSSISDVVNKSQNIKPQKQENQPGDEHAMSPQPECLPFYKGVDKFKNQVVLITGGDSGIGRAVALAFANEGAHISIIYKDEDQDAATTKQMVESYGSKCMLIPGDIGFKDFCMSAVKETVKSLGRLDILINNAGEQHVHEDLREISEDEFDRTFKTNIYSQFYLIQAALDYLPKDSGSIINNASVNAYKGNPNLMDYTSTKGAIIGLTRALAINLAEKGIRVNAVAPGPIWTPLIPSSFDKKKVGSFGEQVPMKRAGQPNECAGAFTWLASKEAAYVTGQVIDPNGGYIVNS